MDDHQVVAAIAAGDPAGTATMYDRYAASLYGYCRWVLFQPTEAAGALQDVFIIAAATLGDLPEVPKLRPWLYSVARNECLRRLRPSAAQRHEDDATDPSADSSSDADRAEVRSFIRSVLAGLRPRERETIELNLMHDLYDNDLAIALGVSWSRAHALASRARDRLGRALGAFVIARTGRQECPALEELLTEWDGRLTEEANHLVSGHIEQCLTCAHHQLGALRPEALSSLLPMAALPAGLREQVLKACMDTSPDAVSYRRRLARHAGSMWFVRLRQAVMPVIGGGGRGNRRSAISTAVLVAWVVAVFVVSIVLLMFTGSHPSHALPAQPAAATTRGSSPAVTPVGAETIPVPTFARPSPTISHHLADRPPPAVPSPSPTIRIEPSSSPSVKRSASPSPKASKSASPSPSPTPTHKPSPSPSPSPSTSGTTP